MLNGNYFIINRRAQRFADMRIAGSTAIFLGENGRPVDNGVVSLAGSAIYAAMFCEEVHNVTLVTDRAGIHDVITILWNTDAGYNSGIAALRDASGIRFSRQEKRINRYAESIAEKLDEGVRLRVTDAVDESDMLVCPECGMLNPRGSMYCLDCGAEL